MDIAHFKSGGYNFRAGFSETGLRELNWVKMPSVPDASLGEPAKKLRKELDEYFEGKRKEFSIPLDLEGISGFRLAVLKKLMAIPCGEVVSYGDIAKDLGKPGGARAVGQANRSNPIAIVIPCHRVIASDNSIGGYAGATRGEGIEKKTRLLQLEGVEVG